MSGICLFKINYEFKTLNSKYFGNLNIKATDGEENGGHGHLTEEEEEHLLS